jgi:aminopeptidase N
VSVEPNTNLTRAEVEVRGRLLYVHSYEIAIDVCSAVAASPAGEPPDRALESHTTVRFDCSEPGASTWIDLVAVELVCAELNGTVLADYDGARLQLPDLAAENTLTVHARCSYSTSGEGMHRAVDPADGQVYLYAQFATAEARRVYACFEQPDLKATFAWRVTAPADWTMLATSPTPEPIHVGRARARWEFAPTPRISTYLTALCAGPYQSVLGEARSTDGRTIPLGVHVRRSMAAHLDADEILGITRAGLAYYERLYGIAYPFTKYDQVFVPEFNLGAMENPGVVTFNEDRFIFRTQVTEAARELRAVVILHEMAHMWFGDLVTMRWWDDVWLNESFAEWAGTAVAAEATRFTEAWSTFAQTRKAWAYRADQLPSTHPIAADMVDLESVYANFDGITYAKGASVLRQLVAFVGREAFVAGLAAHLRRHAWGSATLADLLDALTEASGRDLRPWAQVWLQLPGVTSVEAHAEIDADGIYRSVRLEQLSATRPDGVPATLRPHRIAVGVYRRDRERHLVRTARAEVDLLGSSVALPELAGLPAGDLLLVNDDDLTYVKTRLDKASLATVVAPDGVSALAESLPRALVWSALWEHVRDADLPAQTFVDAALCNLDAEPMARLVETVLGQARIAVDRFVAPALHDDLAIRLCLGSAELLADAEPGSDRQRVLARAHAELAFRPEALDRLEALRTGAEQLPGLPLDLDLTWTVVQRLAARGRLDEAQIEVHAHRDRTSKGMKAAARARASRPDAEAKRVAWRTAIVPGQTPNAVLEGVIAGFADPATPDELLAPYRPAYAEHVPAAFLAQDPMQARAMARGLFPTVGPETVELADRLLGRSDVPSGLRRVIEESRSEVVLALRAREHSAQVAQALAAVAPARR